MFHRSKNESKLRLNKKGFTLIEILIAIGILALITVPLAMNMITSSQMNSKAKQTAAASDLTTTLVEVLQAVDLSDVITDVSGYKTDQYGSKLEYVLIGDDDVVGALGKYSVGNSMEVILDKNGKYIPVSAQDDLMQEYPASIIVKKTEHGVDKVYFVGQDADYDEDGIFDEYAFLLSEVETDEMNVDVLVTITPEETFDIVNISAMNQAEVYCVQQYKEMDKDVAAQYREANALYHELNNSVELKDETYFLENMVRTITIDIQQDVAGDSVTVVITAEYTIDTNCLKDGDKHITKNIGNYSTNSTAEFTKGIYLYYYPLHNGSSSVRDKFIIINENELSVPVFLIALSTDGLINYTDPNAYGNVGGIKYTPDLTVRELSDRVYQKSSRTTVCSNVPNAQWIKNLIPLGNRTLEVKTLGNASKQQTLYSMVVQVYRHRADSYDEDGIFTPRSKDLLIETTGSFIDTSEKMDIDDAKSTGLVTEPGVATAWKYNDLTFNGMQQMGVDGLNVEIVGTQHATEAGTYSATVTPKKNCTWGDGSTSSRTFVWTIERNKSASVVALQPTPVYNGQIQNGVVLSNVVINGGVTSARDAGSYHVQATPTNNYAWSDGTYGTRTITWKILARPTEAIWATGIGLDVWNYDGEIHYGSCTIEGLIAGDVCVPTLTNNAIKDLGTAEARIIGLSNKNYAMPTSNLTHMLKVIVTNAADVRLHNSSGILTYNGNVQEIVKSSVGVYITGDSEAKNVGAYVCYANLMAGYTWEDGSVEPLEIRWFINPAIAELNWGETQWEFDGEDHSTTCIVSNVFDGDTVNVELENNSIKSVGKKTVTAINLSNPNYVVPDSSKTTVIEVVRNPSAVVKTYDFEYDGLKHVGVTGKYIQKDGEISAIDIKTDADGNVVAYVCDVTPSTNYAWADTKTWETRTVEWRIKPIADAWYSIMSKAIYTTNEISPIIRQYNIKAEGDLSATDLGTYTITFTPVENHVWKDGELAGTAKPKTVTWEIVEWSVPRPAFMVAEFEYDGTEHVPQFELATLDHDAYSITGELSGTDAGTYTVTISLMYESSKWEDGTRDPHVITWQIVPRTLEFDYKVDDNTWTYDSYEHVGSVSASNIVDGDEVNLTLSNHKHTNAGTHKFIVSGVDNPNYQLPEPILRTFDMVINQRTVSINWDDDGFYSAANNQYTYTYDGIEKTVTATAGNVADNDTAPTFTYENNTQVNAGTYYPTVIGVSDSNYKLPDATSTTMLINKYVVALTWSNATWVYDNNEHFATADLTLPVNGEMCRPIYDSEVGITDVGTKVRTVVDLTNPNYQLPDTGTSKIMEVTKYDITLDWGDCEWVYNGEMQTKYISGTDPLSWIVPPFDGTVVNISFMNNTMTYPGEEICTATIDNNNYNLTNPAQTIVMDKAPGECGDAIAIDGWTYDTVERALIETAPTNHSGPVVYSLDGTTYSSDIPKATNAGTYTIYYKADESDCYYASEAKTVTVTVAKAPGSYISVPTAASGLVYNGSAQLLLRHYGSSDVGEFKFDRTVGTNAGTYTVNYWCEGGQNYEDCGYGSFDVYISRSPTASVTYTQKVTTWLKDGTTYTAKCHPKYNNCKYTKGETSTTQENALMSFWAIPNTNYAWSDGSYLERVFLWSTGVRGNMEA
jgi:prepilin-type N-terminal cleavage/methylation domain-containing protein